MAMPGVGSGYRAHRADQQCLQAGVIGAQAVRLELHDLPALGERPGVGVPGDLIDGYLHLPFVRPPVIGMGSQRYRRLVPRSVAENLSFGGRPRRCLSYE